ncbi:aldo/keto reductase [Atribacter laminatus]|uniref:General stress protein 69 n=1 Tax=Atribacter laminatus TaxID=2847778 RepID=A0A7T1AMY1_ATRLM|nr:aldo/keto reductase [Atribacter laminatus]QPM68879.1 General stress protein 69 [Atribacter laminatus]
MKYRILGSTKEKVSALGFGCMRLPTIDHKPSSGEIDEAETIRMLQYAIDNGVNYIDSAYTYHNGRSEEVIGRALQDGYRKKVLLTTKMPIWLVEKSNDFDRFLHEQLSRLKTDYLDVYLLHNLKKKTFHQLLNLGIFSWAEKAIDKGLFRYFGFSCHEPFSVFKVFIDSYDRWSIAQIQYNYMNEDVQAGTKGLKYAAKKDIAVVIMEPLLGGTLANPHPEILSLLNQANPQRSPVDWALQWLWNKPEVSTVLSGMSSFTQVQQNINSANHSDVNSLRSEELDTISRAQSRYSSMNPVPCTKCGYCMPCPNQVDIPRNFELFNTALVFNQVNLNKNIYQNIFPEEMHAASCIQCGICEEKCPQNIPIREWLRKVEELLGKKEIKD